MTDLGMLRKRAEQVNDANVPFSGYIIEDAADEIEALRAILDQVGGWIDDAPPNSAGLDLLRQIITPVDALRGGLDG